MTEVRHVGTWRYIAIPQVLARAEAAAISRYQDTTDVVILEQGLHALTHFVVHLRIKAIQLVGTVEYQFGDTVVNREF